MVTTYIAIALVTAAGVLAASDWSGSEVHPVARESLSALAGVLWPLLLVGAVQLLIIALAQTVLGNPLRKLLSAPRFG